MCEIWALTPDAASSVGQGNGLPPQVAAPQDPRIAQCPSFATSESCRLSWKRCVAIADAAYTFEGCYYELRSEVVVNVVQAVERSAAADGC